MSASDLTERIIRAERAIAAYAPDFDAGPAAVIGALLDFAAVTSTTPAVLTRAVVEHVAHTPFTRIETSGIDQVEETDGTFAADPPADSEHEFAYARLAGAIIGSLLDEARHMSRISPMDLLGIAHHAYDSYTHPED
ncbi:hypothetical protein AB0C84_40475 [Actinomadura sp. NPDC048955]|uniref:hypothetical protein n=1 Tax=Actinomadura sp. NPDC048955 TaxID=3158228 RepID=UPI00340CC445